jgi:hypothetical protein
VAGTALSDFRDHDFAYDEIRRLEALRADATEAGFEAGLQLGRSAELIARLEAEVTVNPLRERLWGQADARDVQGRAARRCVTDLRPATDRAGSRTERLARCGAGAAGIPNPLGIS